MCELNYQTHQQKHHQQKISYDLMRYQPLEIQHSMLTIINAVHMQLGNVSTHPTLLYWLVAYQLYLRVTVISLIVATKSSFHSCPAIISPKTVYSEQRFDQPHMMVAGEAVSDGSCSSRVQLWTIMQSFITSSGSIYFSRDKGVVEGCPRAFKSRGEPHPRLGMIPNTPPL